MFSDHNRIKLKRLSFHLVYDFFTIHKLLNLSLICLFFFYFHYSRKWIKKKYFYTSVSLLLSHIQGYCYHVSKFHIYALVYYLVFFFLAYFTLDNRLQFHPPH